MSSPQFTKWIFETESLLRGTYLRMAVDAEFILCMVIVSIYENNNTEINTHFKKDKTHFKGLHEMSMEEIIILTKIGLNKYRQSFFEEYKDEINKLDILREDRNIFAHSKMDFYEDNLDLVMVSKLVNKLKVKQVFYKISDLKASLLEHHKSITKVLDLLLRFTNPAPLPVE